MIEHLKRMVSKHPNLALAGLGMLLVLATPVLFNNSFMLHQYGWINLSLEVQFAGVMVQIALIGVGMFLLIMATLQGVRRWLHVSDDVAQTPKPPDSQPPASN